MTGQAVFPMHTNAPERRLPAMPPYGTFVTPSGKHSGFWALPRPLTSHWGQGEELMQRIAGLWGEPDIIFGKQDTVRGLTVDADPATAPSVVADWAAMPFADQSRSFGYWDPPYLGRIGEDGDVHYDRMDPCLREICRVLSVRLVILSPLIYPCPKGWSREGIVAVTYGPNKVIRAVQSFVRSAQAALGFEDGRTDPADDLGGDVVKRPGHVELAVLEAASTHDAADDGRGRGPRDADAPIAGELRIDEVSQRDRSVTNIQTHAQHPTAAEAASGA